MSRFTLLTLLIIFAACEAPVAPDDVPEDSSAQAPVDPVEPDDEPTDPPPPPPPPETALRGDPHFDPATLSDDEALWAARLDQSIADAAGTFASRADSGDLYELGRHLGDATAALLLGLRATGNLAYLDDALQLWEIARADLADAWLDGTEDGYLNWLFLADPAAETLYGRDTISMDEAMVHGNVALLAHALHVNRDLDGRYAAAADFWLDYLENHFLAKWTDREGSREAAWTSGFYKRFTHPRANQLRLAHYLAEITGDPFYRAREVEIAEELAAHAVAHDFVAGGVQWKHQVAGSDQGWQKINYAQYLMRVVVEMHAQGVAPFSLDSTMEGYAATFAQAVIGPHGPDHDVMALRVDGSETTGTQLYALPALARWDASGTLISVAEDRFDPGSAGVSVAAAALYAVSDRPTR